MRKAAILAVALVLAFGGTAMAKSSVAKVTGNATYWLNGDPQIWRTLSVTAQASDPLKGTWTWITPLYNQSGPISCMRVAGDDAWFAGPSSGPSPAVFFWVHDGGTPGTSGDRVFVWGADPGQTLADMELLCATMSTDFFGYTSNPLVTGNFMVRAGG